MDDLHGTRPRPGQDLDQTNFSQKIRFKNWTVYEVGMKFKHFKRERVLHDDRIEIVPNLKHFGVVLQSTVLTNCKQAPTPSAVGSVKQKFDDGVVLDMQERRSYRGIVGSLQYLSIDCCDMHFETCLCEGDEATDRSFMDTTETIGPIFGKSPVRVLLTLEQTMPRMVHFFASLVGQWFGWKCQGQEKSIELETWGRWMSAVFCIKKTEVTRAVKWWSWVLRCSIDHQWSNVDPRSLVVHGIGSSDRTIAGQCSSTWQMQTWRCRNHTSFVKTSSLATAVGKTRGDHGWSVCTSAENRADLENVIICSQISTADAVERLGVGPTKEFGD